MVDQSTMRPRRSLDPAKTLDVKVGQSERHLQVEASVARNCTLIFFIPTIGIVPGVQAASAVVVLADRVCIEKLSSVGFACVIGESKQLTHKNNKRCSSSDWFREKIN